MINGQKDSMLDLFQRWYTLLKYQIKIFIILAVLRRGGWRGPSPELRARATLLCRFQEEHNVAKFSIFFYLLHKFDV